MPDQEQVVNSGDGGDQHRRPQVGAPRLGWIEEVYLVASPGQFYSIMMFGKEHFTPALGGKDEDRLIMQWWHTIWGDSITALCEMT